MNWNEYYIGIAKAVAKKSKDPSIQVGCVLVYTYALPFDRIRRLNKGYANDSNRQNISGCQVFALYLPLSKVEPNQH